MQATPDEPSTLTGAATALGRSLITALPPAFVMLCVVNAVFVLGLTWFVDDQLDQRTQLVGRLIDHCMPK